MTTPQETSRRSERTILYVVIAVVLVALAITGLFTYNAAKSNREAEAKADRLIAALKQAGARPPTRDQIVRVLGDDGGAVCTDPNGALNQAALSAQLANGAGGPGTRPVIADSQVIEGERQIIKIYCPGELADFDQYVDDLQLNDDVAGG